MAQRFAQSADHPLDEQDGDALGKWGQMDTAPIYDALGKWGQVDTAPIYGADLRLPGKWGQVDTVRI
jgi:hypothetical protein